ncbi:MgtC/SapB family protein [Actinopolyspora halophila]|uniref:MgtC/SapB family protein n=1 Tax=Actinopolyspora halophila TaxID=1850 RepID=UPI000360367D|nr:MgtC/SapB family protein [Actinopolyspora halophila]
MTSSITGLGELPMLVELGTALLLSSLIGLEREVRAKSAGLRTHTLVGVGTALLVLVSKYGFLDTLEWSNVQLGPSRVAAQIVSGIGFIGGGLIFVRRDAVRGLTTAATVWMVAAVGMACGSGLLVLASATTLAHFIVAVGYQYLVTLLRKMMREPQGVRIGYLDGHGVLRNVLTLCTSSGWAVLDLQVEREDSDDRNQRTAVVVLRLRGRRDVTALLDELSALPGVLHVASSEPVENGF